MNIIDIIILVGCIPALIQGIRKGFISQTVSLVSLVVGAWLAFKFSAPLGEWIKDYLEFPGAIIHIVAFALILLAVTVVLNLLGNMIERIVKFVMLGWMDKLLGAAFSLLKAVLLLGLLLILLDTLNSTLPIIPAKVFEGSVLHDPVKNIAETVFPYLKELIFNK